MVVTEEKIRVTAEMMSDANMIRGGQFGVPVNPERPTEGLRWKWLFELEDSDFDAIESYFLNRLRK